MSKKDCGHKECDHGHQFMYEMVDLINRYSDKVSLDEVINGLQGILYSMVQQAVPSDEEAAEYLYDSIDEYFADVEEEDLPEDATVIIK